MSTQLRLVEVPRKKIATGRVSRGPARRRPAWKLDAGTRQVGLEGVAAARIALERARGTSDRQLSEAG
ncbi:MAG TPA: hypothetical protein VF441_08130 [Acidimicrobiia bacterium]